MSEITDEARSWLSSRHRAVLVTLRRDGTAQTSNVVTAFGDDTFRVSVTADRAKTRNLARDPRAVVHVLGADFWSFASVPCTASVGQVSVEPGDSAGRDLLELYNVIADVPHPDPAEFLDAQVAERRCVLTLQATGITGAGWAAR